MADVYLAVAPMASPAKAETPWRRNGDGRLCAVVLNLAQFPLADAHSRVGSAVHETEN